MEKRIFSTFKELNLAEYKSDDGLDTNLSVNRTASSVSSGGASESTDTDWTIHSDAPASVGEDIHYQEFVAHGANPGGIRPIKDQADAERCIIALDFFEPGDDRTISVRVNDPHANINDEVSFSTHKGSFSTEKKNFSGQVLFENTQFFTVQLGDGQFRTYLDMNDDGNYGLVEHSDPRTFDHFRFSFLTRV